MEFVQAVYNQAVNKFYSVFAGYFRRRRHRWLASEFRNCRTVIDLGGTVEMWEELSFAERVTLLNIGDAPANLPRKFQYLQGDGKDTRLPDAAFDLAFSNSAIEHVGDFENQRRFAKEMLRLGRHIYCQTPNKRFPVEPHFLGLFVHWLPREWFGYALYRYFTINGWIAKPDRKKCAELVASVRLLTRKELVQLFPGCKVKTERFLGLPKSYIVFR
jgi:Methyltransferase domain